MQTFFRWMPIGVIVSVQAGAAVLLAYVTSNLANGYDTANWYEGFAMGFTGGSAVLYLYYLARSLKAIWEMIADGE